MTDKDDRIRTRPLVDAFKLRDALAAELAKMRTPVLLVVSGPDVGRRVPLTKSVVIGRDPAATLPLRDATASWQHLCIEDRGGGEWAVVDLGSTNGTTFIAKGGETGRVDAARPLRPGDRFALGQTIVEYDEEDPLRAGYNEEVQRQLSIDELSGLWAKRRFDTQLEANVMAVSLGAQEALSLLVMDLDGVKAINDTHGHEAGAFTIGTAGHIIGGFIDDSGFATRFGGDEFVAAVPAMSKTDAVAFAEKLRARVAEHRYLFRGHELRVGLSCGVATTPDDAKTAEELFHAADQAMYRAKRGGKNRVCT